MVGWSLARVYAWLGSYFAMFGFITKAYLVFATRIALYLVRNLHTISEMSDTLRVLGVYELLQIITDNLTPPDLASFAQTSRLVSDRSLDVLWKCLPTTIPLLALLPSVDLIDGQYVRIRVFRSLCGTNFPVNRRSIFKGLSVQLNG